MKFKKIKIIILSSILALGLSIYAMQIITSRFTQKAIAAAANAIIPKLLNRVSYLVRIILKGDSKQANEIIIRQEYTQNLNNAANISEGLTKVQPQQIKILRDIHINLNSNDTNIDDVSKLINFYLQALEKNNAIVSRDLQDKNLAVINKFGLNLTNNGTYSGYPNEQDLIVDKLKANIAALDTLTQLKINNLFAFSTLFFHIVKDINSACKLAIDLVKKQDAENKNIQDLCKNDKFLEIYKQATEYAYKLSLIASNNALPSYIRQTVMLEMNTIKIEGAFGRSYNKLLSALNSYYFLPNGTFSVNGFTENPGSHIVDFIGEIATNKENYLAYLKSACDAGIIDAQNAYYSELRKPRFKSVNKNFSSKVGTKFLDYYFDNAKKAFNKITSFFTGRNFVTPTQVVNNPYNKDYLYLINILSNDNLSHDFRLSSAGRILKKYQNDARNTIGYDYYTPIHNVIGEYQNAFNQASKDLSDFINKCCSGQPELPITRPPIITELPVQNGPCLPGSIEIPKGGICGEDQKKTDDEEKKICDTGKENKEIKGWECDYTKRQNLSGLKDHDPKIANNQNGPSEPNHNDRDSIAKANQQEKQKTANENRENQQEEKIEQERESQPEEVQAEPKKGTNNEVQDSQNEKIQQEDELSREYDREIQIIKDKLRRKIEDIRKKMEEEINALSETNRIPGEAKIRRGRQRHIEKITEDAERQIAAKEKNKRDRIPTKSQQKKEKLLKIINNLALSDFIVGIEDVQKVIKLIHYFNNGNYDGAIEVIEDIINQGTRYAKEKSLNRANGSIQELIISFEFETNDNLKTLKFRIKQPITEAERSLLNLGKDKKFIEFDFLLENGTLVEVKNKLWTEFNKLEKIKGAQENGLTNFDRLIGLSKDQIKDLAKEIGLSQDEATIIENIRDQLVQLRSQKYMSKKNNNDYLFHSQHVLPQNLQDWINKEGIRIIHGRCNNCNRCSNIN